MTPPPPSHPFPSHRARALAGRSLAKPDLSSRFWWRAHSALESWSKERGAAGSSLLSRPRFRRSATFSRHASTRRHSSHKCVCLYNRALPALISTYTRPCTPRVVASLSLRPQRKRRAELEQADLTATLATLRARIAALEHLRTATRDALPPLTAAAAIAAAPSATLASTPTPAASSAPRIDEPDHAAPAEPGDEPIAGVEPALLARLRARCAAKIADLERFYAAWASPIAPVLPTPRAPASAAAPNADISGAMSARADASSPSSSSRSPPPRATHHRPRCPHPTAARTHRHGAGEPGAGAAASSTAAAVPSTTTISTTASDGSGGAPSESDGDRWEAARHHRSSLGRRGMPASRPSRHNGKDERARTPSHKSDDASGEGADSVAADYSGSGQRVATASDMGELLGFDDNTEEAAKSSEESVVERPSTPEQFLCPITLTIMEVFSPCSSLLCSLTVSLCGLGAGPCYCP